MTDEEKALYYINNIHIKYNEILSRPEVVDEIRKAFLAGLEAGKDKVIQELEKENAELNCVVRRYAHCAEIEEPKTRRMTKKELSRWLREKPTREFKYCKSAKRERLFVERNCTSSTSKGDKRK